MDKQLACRLSHASNLAYAIPRTGPYPALNNDLTAVGLSPTGCQFFRPTAMDNINACYYGVNTGNEAILAFRGTQPPTLIFKDPEKFFQVVVDDWLNDANAALVSGADLPGKVHRGFLASLDTLWSDLITFLRANHDKTKPLYITGHSKGGGLAFLAAYRLCNDGFNPVVYTFAAPRVGDAAFAAVFDDKLKSSTCRFEYQDDIVPHLPPHTGGWVEFLGAMKVVKVKLPFDDHQLGSNFTKLVDRINKLKEEGLANYTSAGMPEFINWDNPPNAQAESPSLTRYREFHLAEKILTAQDIELVKDHFLEPGYMKFVCS